MAPALIRRIGRGLFTLALLMVLAFLCLEAAPGEPAEAAARARGLLPEDRAALPSQARQAIVAEVARAEHLDRPLGARLVAYLMAAAQGDLGHSWRDGLSVASQVARVLPTTLALVVLATLFAYLLGMLGALVSAASPGSFRDRVLLVVATALLALPPAWVAILVLGRWEEAALRSYLFPLGCLAYVAAAVVTRHGRASLIMVRQSGFATAVRAKGASEWRVLSVHALAVSARPVLALSSVLVPYLLGASLVIERAFDLDGLLCLLLDASAVGDAPVVLGVTLVAGVLVIVSSALADLFMGMCDPRLEGPSA